MTVTQEAVDFSEFTLNDIHVGTYLYSALVAHARSRPGEPVFYSEILQQARAMAPNDEELQRAVPIGIGMKLLFVESFCVRNGYPNLACLAVSKARGRPGEGYKGDWQQDMRAVAQFDWSTVQASLDTYVHDARLAVTPKKRRTDEEARALRWEVYSKDREAYRTFTDEEKAEFLNLLIEGLQPEQAYRRIIDARAAGSQ